MKENTDIEESKGSEEVPVRRKKTKKRHAVRREETKFQKHFQKVGGGIALILLVLSTILTVRKVQESGIRLPWGAAGGLTDLGPADPADTSLSSGLSSRDISSPDDAWAGLPEQSPELKLQSFYDSADADGDQGITILCGGDNLIHESIYERAETGSGYDFSYLYNNVRSFIKSADIATINQEGPLATALAEPSGYPLFNTPKEIGPALADAGFDVVNIGNNHIYDQGSAGALATEEALMNDNIPSVGFYKDTQDYQNLRIIEKGGIKVAFLGFTEMTNQDPDDPGKGSVVTFEDRDAIKEQIGEAKKQADIVAVHAHWGEEGTTELTDEQVEMAELMVEWGADIVFGNHPHVIQELTTITRESDGQVCPVIYSMGNFVSAQKHRRQLVSAMLAVRVRRDEDGAARPAEMGVMPVITHFETEERSDVALYPLAAYSGELADRHAANWTDDDFSMDYIYGVVYDSIPEQYVGKMSEITNE